MSERRSAQIASWLAIASLAVALISAAYAFGGRISTVETKQGATEQRVERLEGTTQVIQSIDRRLARIEGALGVTKPEQQ